MQVDPALLVCFFLFHNNTAEPHGILKVAYIEYMGVFWLDLWVDMGNTYGLTDYADAENRQHRSHA
jgi:hypothetical protein